MSGATRTRRVPDNEGDHHHVRSCVCGGGPGGAGRGGHVLPADRPRDRPPCCPYFVGAGRPRRSPSTASIPQNPSLAPNPFSYLHNDSWNSDVFQRMGAVGQRPAGLLLHARRERVRRRADDHLDGPVDTYGRRLVAVAIDPTGSYLLLIDPESLEVTYSKKLGEGGTKAIGSAYWYLDRALPRRPSSPARTRS